MSVKLNVPAVLIFIIPGVFHNNIPFASVKLIGTRNQNEKAFNVVSKMIQDCNASLRRGDNTRKVSLRNSLRWPIYYQFS